MRSSPSVYREEVAKQHSPNMVAGLGHEVVPDDHAHHGLAHIVPPTILIVVFVALMFLTALTVGVTYIDFGYNINLAVALGIAVVKAMLVILYFMHLRWDSPLYSIIIFACMIFIMLFIFTTVMDSGQYFNILTPVAPV